MKYREYLNHKLATDEAFRKEYEALGPEFEFIETLITARLAAGLTQQQLAEAIGTSQPAIARLEGGQALPNTRTMLRLARALNLVIQITPEEKIEAHAALSTG